MIEIDALIKTANNLAPLPETVNRMMELLSKSDVSIRDLEATLGHDGVMTTRLLRMANASAMRGRDRVGTLHAAVVRLGLGNLLAIAVGAGAQKEMNVEMPEYGLDKGWMWEHSHAARLAVNVIKRYSKRDVPPEALTAALLHDIGKIVLAHHLDRDDLELLNRASDDPHHIQSSVEKEVLQVEHGELGGLIAEHWKLPDLIVRGITYHHNPDACEQADNTICHVVAMADWLAHQAERDGDKNAEIPSPIMASLERLGIDQTQAAAMVEDLQKQVAQIRVH